MEDGENQIQEPDQLAGQEEGTASAQRKNSFTSNTAASDSKTTIGSTSANTTTKEAKELARQWDEDDRTRKRKSLGSSNKKKRRASLPGATQVSTRKRLSFPHEKFGRATSIADRVISAPLSLAQEERQDGGLEHPFSTSETFSNRPVQDDIARSVSGPILYQRDQHEDGQSNPSNVAHTLSTDSVPIPPMASETSPGDEENQKEESPRESLLVEASLVGIGYNESDILVPHEKEDDAITDIPRAEVVQQGNLLWQYGPKTAGSRWLCFGISALIALVAATGIVCGSGACAPTDNQPQLSSFNNNNKGSPLPVGSLATSISSTTSLVPTTTINASISTPNPLLDKPTSAPSTSKIWAAVPNTSSSMPTMPSSSIEFPQSQISIQGTTREPTLAPSTYAPSIIPSVHPSVVPTRIPSTSKPRTKCDKLYESSYPFGYESAYPLSSVALNCQPFDEPDPPMLHGVLYGCNAVNQGAQAPANIKSHSFTEVCIAAVTEQTAFTCYQMSADTDYTAFQESVDEALTCKEGDTFDRPKYMYLQTTAAYYAGGGSGSQSTQIPHAGDSFSQIEEWVHEAYYVGTVTSRLPQAEQRGMPSSDIHNLN